MSLSELISHFSSHPTKAGFWSSSPPDNITLNPANEKTDQSLPDFQTCIGVVAHATLDIEQVISHARTALIDTIAFVQDSDWAVIPVVKCMNY